MPHDGVSSLAGGSILGPSCSLLCSAQREGKSRQHSWSPQPAGNRPPYTVQVAFPKSLWAPLCLQCLFPLLSSHSGLIPFLPEDSAEVSAPPKSCSLHSALSPAPGSTSLGTSLLGKQNIHTSRWLPGAATGKGWVFPNHHPSASTGIPEHRSSPV